MVATIENIPIQLGDILNVPGATGLFQHGRVRGWSADGSQVSLGWLGTVAIAEARWNTDVKASKFQLHYRPAKINEGIAPVNAPEYRHAVQLELDIDANKNRPCEAISAGLDHPGLIPGLEASLCRCAACKSRADGGIWWFDATMRSRVLKREMPYRFKPVGDLIRDEE